jgi:hypothetical protein
MKLVGSNPQAKVSGAAPLPARTDYFLGNDPKKWRTNVRSFEKVQYQGVYPGVDLVYYGNQNQLEYDFIVKPGADPDQIRLSYSGAEKVEVDKSGDLVLHTPGGDVRQHKPVVYQEVSGKRVPVEGGYVLQAEGPSAECKEQSARARNAFPPPIHPPKPLPRHIAPGGKPRAGGAGRSPRQEAACPRLPAGEGRPGQAYTHAPTQVSFRVAAYDPTHRLIIDPTLSYSSYLGGNHFDGGYLVAVDGSGSAYVAGQTLSTTFPHTAGAFQGAAHGADDLFVAKFSPNGASLLYSTYLGGSGTDVVNGLGVDASGNAYVSGETFSSNFPSTAGAFQRSSAGMTDVFVTKLNPTGSALVFSTYLGGAGADFGGGLALDGARNVFVTGSAELDFPVTTGAFQTMAKSRDVFVTKLRADGAALLYSTFIGGTDIDRGWRLAVDAAGSAFVTGNTLSANFPVTAGAFQRHFGGSGSFGQGDAFVVKLNPAGTALVYATYLGGSGDEFGFNGAIALDGSGSAYIAGTTNSPNFATLTAFQPQLGGGDRDAFLVKLSASGNLIEYGTYLGGSDSDAATGALAVDASGSAYLTGTTASPDFPTTPDATRRTFSGGATDAFITKLAADGTAIAYSSYLGGSGRDSGGGIAVGGAPASAYVGGTTLSVNFPTTPQAFQRVHAADGADGDAFVLKISGFSTVHPPASATNLAAEEASATQINLTWDPRSLSDEIPGHQEIQRRTGSMPFSTIATVLDGEPVYMDQGLPPDTAFTYRVRSVTAGGIADSNLATAATATFTIRGIVTDGSGRPGAALSGVKIAVVGASSVTNFRGGYLLGGLAPGTYEVKPSRAFYSFAPVSRFVHLGPDAAGVSFVGTPVVPRLVGLWPTPANVIGGESVQYHLDFDAPLTRRVSVQLRSSRPRLARVPGTVRIAVGAQSYPVIVHTRIVSSSARVTITARFGRQKREAVLMVDPGGRER